MIVKYLPLKHPTNPVICTMSDGEVEDLEINAGFFEEPEDFRPQAPTASDIVYERKHAGSSSNLVPLRLIGSSPLYGHILTNAAKYTAEFLDKNPDWVSGKTVLEFGSGGALPSIISALNGAKLVVTTDYPDVELINNISYNIKQNNLEAAAIAKGFIWGDDTTEIREIIQTATGKSTVDLLILSDVIFNHTEHSKLLKTCLELINRDGTGKCLVVFSPHRPHLLDKDLEFFQTAAHSGFKHTFIEEQIWSPLFASDTDESTAELRSKVFAHLLEI
ncbi:unnamed protein product [Kuraishia capsulata CBS 1993]|uniref:Elongation factor methyltransferase 7 n=1 Tax=Kuraishia capsulata CBS 1993 TaxID=1382522 RepID=W6MQN0_9ASCO|nr:uncharacterized protein KUCA_T00005025001 [Kuraishia capsulata CBS 1993]CDK29039.1 unnamed protein product [Kuraishia capsulata CBS 1993]